MSTQLNNFCQQRASWTTIAGDRAASTLSVSRPNCTQLPWCGDLPGPATPASSRNYCSSRFPCCCRSCCCPTHPVSLDPPSHWLPAQTPSCLELHLFFSFLTRLRANNLFPDTEHTRALLPTMSGLLSTACCPLVLDKDHGFKWLVLPICQILKIDDLSKHWGHV